MKIHESPTRNDNQHGVLTSMESEQSDGLRINLLLWNGKLLIKFVVHDPKAGAFNKYFTEVAQSPTLDTWIHYTMTYNLSNPKDPGSQFTTYVNGFPTHLSSQGQKDDTLNLSGGERLVVGRMFTEDDGRYSFVSLDDIMLFNGIISEEQAAQLYKLY